MQRKFVGLVFILTGLLLMFGGLVAQIAWIGFCFGTVIVGLLMLCFAPALLFLPFTLMMASGTALWGSGILMVSGGDS